MDTCLSGIGPPFWCTIAQNNDRAPLNNWEADRVIFSRVVRVQLGEVKLNGCKGFVLCAVILVLNVCTVQTRNHLDTAPYEPAARHKPALTKPYPVH